MTAITGRIWICLFAALAALVLATRFHHFGTVLHLPDASMAIFFLGGLYLRRHWTFVTYLLLALAIDWIAIEYNGVSDFCVTPAYSFLVPAYAVLWYSGRLYSTRLRASVGSLLGLAAVGLIAASVSFLMSNGAFYWLGGRHTDLSIGGWLANAWTWGPLFVRTTMAYVATAALVHGLWLAFGRGQGRDRSART